MFEIGMVEIPGQIFANIQSFVFMVLFVFSCVMLGKTIIRKSHCPSSKDVEQTKEIYNELVGLRALTEADRVYVSRFHNGVEFLPSNPAWKVSRSHEIVRRGVTYESVNLQNILVSLIPHIVEPIIMGTSSNPGIKLSVCENCPSKVNCLRANKRIVVIQVDEMGTSYCKFYLENQNVKTRIVCGITKNGKATGFVGVDFCANKIKEEDIQKIVNQLCLHTEKINYRLQFKKIPNGFVNIGQETA